MALGTACERQSGFSIAVPSHAAIVHAAAALELVKSEQCLRLRKITFKLNVERSPLEMTPRVQQSETCGSSEVTNAREVPALLRPYLRPLEMQTQSIDAMAIRVDSSGVCPAGKAIA